MCTLVAVVTIARLKGWSGTYSVVSLLQEIPQRGHSTAVALPAGVFVPGNVTAVTGAAALTARGTHAHEAQRQRMKILALIARDGRCVDIAELLYRSIAVRCGSSR
jgi:hypothetical protein